MKKLVLFFAVIVAVSFASCGNKAEAPAEATTEEAVAVEEPAAAPVDSPAVATEAAPAAETAAPAAE